MEKTVEIICDECGGDGYTEHAHLPESDTRECAECSGRCTVSITAEEAGEMINNLTEKVKELKNQLRLKR